MNEKGDCIHYSEVQDMNAIVPCCDFYEFGNTPCKDCKRYYSKKDLVAVVRCKDCKYLKEIDPDNLYVCNRIDIGMDGEPSFLKPEADFCSRAERRETK